MKYLLITGSYRSGTTFLFKAFKANANCEMIYQPTIKLFKYIDTELRKKLKKKQFNNFPLGLTNISKKIDLNNIILDKKKVMLILKNLIKVNDKNILFYEKLFQNISKENKKLNFKTIISHVFNSIKTTENKKIYGIKELYIADISKLLIKLKNLYIINIIRDPREILYSRNYSIFKNHINFNNKKHPVILNALICNQNMNSDQKMKKNKRYLSIKFDDLIGNHVKIEKKIAKFLKLKISLNLNYIKKKTKWKINSSGHKPNYGSGWKKNLKIDELDIVEKICGKNMTKYGFKLNNKNLKTLKKSLSNFKENKSSILKWTNRNIFLKYSDKTAKEL